MGDAVNALGIKKMTCDLNHHLGDLLQHIQR